MASYIYYPQRLRVNAKKFSNAFYNIFMSGFLIISSAEFKNRSKLLKSNFLFQYGLAIAFPLLITTSLYFFLVREATSTTHQTFRISQESNER